MRREDAYRVVQRPRHGGLARGDGLPQARGRRPRGAGRAEGARDRGGLPPGALPRSTWTRSSSACSRLRPAMRRRRPKRERASRRPAAGPVLESAPSCSGSYLAARAGLAPGRRALLRRAARRHAAPRATTAWWRRCSGRSRYALFLAGRLGGRAPPAPARRAGRRASTACSSRWRVLLASAGPRCGPGACSWAGTRRESRARRPPTAWPREFGPLFAQAGRDLHRGAGRDHPAPALRRERGLAGGVAGRGLAGHRPGRPGHARPTCSPASP